MYSSASWSVQSVEKNSFYHRPALRAKTYFQVSMKGKLVQDLKATWRMVEKTWKKMKKKWKNMKINEINCKELQKIITENREVGKLIDSLIFQSLFYFILFYFCKHRYINGIYRISFIYSVSNLHGIITYWLYKSSRSLSI